MTSLPFISSGDFFTVYGSLTSIITSSSIGKFLYSISSDSHWTWSIISHTFSTFLFLIAWVNNSESNIASSLSTLSKQAHVEGLSDITPQYSGILQAKS